MSKNGVSMNFKFDEKAFEKNAQKAVKKIIKSKPVSIDCPKCKNKIGVTVGQNVCPHCGAKVTFNLE